MTLNEPRNSSTDSQESWQDSRIAAWYAEMQPEAMVNEQVRLVRQIAEGGMGSVWLGHHLALDSKVAVKFMAPVLAVNPGAVERFVREAKASAVMHHPHVVQIIDTGTTAGGLPYLVMEYLEGDDLETRVHERGPLSVSNAALVVMHTGRALERAHELGVIHRDIKPENIFLLGGPSDEIFVKILDFGIAKDTRGIDAGPRVTKTGTTLGTPSYMSPEQMVSSKNCDYRCDLWALAVTTYYALTAELPFTGETYAAICLAVNRGTFKMPSKIRRDLPPALDDWFRRALARDPRKRFDSAREMVAAFVRIVDSQASRNRRAVTPFSLRATLGGASLTNAGAEERTSRWIPYVGVVSIAAGALLAVGFSPRASAHHSAAAVPAMTAAAVPGSAATVPGAELSPVEPAPVNAVAAAKDPADSVVVARVPVTSAKSQATARVAPKEAAPPSTSATSVQKVIAKATATASARRPAAPAAPSAHEDDAAPVPVAPAVVNPSDPDPTPTPDPGA